MFKSIFLLSLLGFVSMDEVPIQTVSGDGVRSIGFQYMYGDDHMSIVNQVVVEGEKLNQMKPPLNLGETIPPLPAEDVKCLMSVDRYCSKDMLAMKNVLVQALKEDCVKCTKEEKEKAGRVVASMLAHDPTAWKLFLTRTAIQTLPVKKPIKEEKLHFKLQGEPEIIENSKRRHLMPGVKVRVKRFAMEKVN